MKKRVFLGICIVICVLAFAACAQSSKGTKSGDKITITEEGLCQIQVPKDWVTTPEKYRNYFADIQYSSPSNESSILVIVDRKADLDLNLQEYTELIPLGDFDEGAANEEITNLVRISQDNTEIKGFPATLTELSCTVNSVNLVFWVYVLETDLNFVQLTGYSTISKKKTCKPVIKEIVDSFKELPPKEREVTPLRKTAASDNKLYQVQIPDDWVEFPEDERDYEYCLQYQNPEDDCHFEILNVGKDETALASLEEYADFVNDILEGFFDRVDKKSQVRLDIGGRQVMLTEFLYTVNSYNMVCWQFVLETETDFVELSGSSVRRNKDIYEPIIREIVESFQEV